MAFLDGTVVNVALPVVERKLHAPFGRVQWVIEAYLLFLSALILVGGALGDRFGRRRVFMAGTALFALASAACGVAPSIGVLVAARAVQGIGAALLVPESLALITAVFPEEARGAAIGAWSGATALTTALGPLLGGFLVQAVSWRSVFFLNLPIAAAAIGISIRSVPESRDPSSAPIDFAGAALAVVSLASLVFGLTEAARRQAGSAFVRAPLATGIAAAAAFVVRESRAAHPMLPLGLFRARAFSAANAFTLLLYAGLGAALFFVPFELIQARGETPTRAGASLLPFVAEMSALSRLTGRLGERVGPRLPLAGGAMTAALGLTLFLIVPPSAGFAAAVLLPIAILGLGMTLAVPTLTATVMGSAAPAHAGIVSAFNNAVSRLGGLLAIAALTIAVGRTPRAFFAPDSRGFRTAMAGSAMLALSAAVLAVLAFPAAKSRRRRAANRRAG